MTIDKDTPKGISEAGAGKPEPASALLQLIETELAGVEDIYKNLSSEYDDAVYETFEKRFIGIRNTFKAKLRDMSDEHYEFIRRSPKKTAALEKILQSATTVAERFQEAREKKRLDRPNTTSPLEDLIYDLKNLKHVIEEQAKS